MEQQDSLRQLRELIVQSGITQASAAKRLKISPPYLNRVLAGEQFPSDELMKKMNELIDKLKRSGLVAG